MKKCLFVLFLSLALISGLSAVFSVYESPNGHVYNPNYTQCESFNVIPATASSVIVSYSITSDPTINASVIQNTGTITFTVQGIAIYGYFAVSIDGAIISDYTLNGCDISFNRSLVSGKHTIAGTYRLTDNTYNELAFKFEFEVTSTTCYYQNSYAKIYPCTNSISNTDYGSVRPALFVEGFSVPGIMNGGDKYTQALIKKWQWNLTNSRIYMLSLNNPSDDVRNNAMVVLGALRFIHNIQASPLVEGTSVFGYSLGGILARYALAFAEQWNIQHYCTQYISLDSPHRGGTINLNMQNTMKRLQEILDHLDHPDNRLNAALSALNSTAAKQLIRENCYATNNSYDLGSGQYRDLFAEINEEDNSNQDQIAILNSNPGSYEGIVKPGFPYKQNKIRCFAYSNGSLELSGNVNDDPLAMNWSLDVVFHTDHTGHADKCEYDRQPGSVFGEDLSVYLEGPLNTYEFRLDQYYAPVIVPTRSSLYLKSNSISGGSPVTELDISYQTAITNNTEILLDHTYFDHIVYASAVPFPITEPPQYDNNQVEIIIPHKADFNEWNWKHGELGWSKYNFDNWVDFNIQESTSWLNQIENRTVCTISGQINGSDFSDITGTMFINGQQNENIIIDQYGNYQISYLYTKNASVRLVFEKPGCFPTYRNINITSYNGIINDHTVPNISMIQFNLNNILVSNAGIGSFDTINGAIDFVMDYVVSGLYNGEAIKIRVLPGMYSESVDLSSLAALGISNFTLEGVGNAIINGSDYGINLVIPDDTTICNGAVYHINNLKFTNSVRGIRFKDCVDNNSEPLQTPRLTLHINNCTVYDCGTNSYTDNNGTIFSAAGIHFEGAGSILNCHFNNNNIQSSDENCSLYVQAGGVYICNNTASTTEVRFNTFTNNTGGLCGGLTAKGRGQIRISDNEFSGNIEVGSCIVPNALNSNAMTVYDASNMLIRNNIIIDNTQENAAIGLTTYTNQAASPIMFLNNTIIKAPQPYNYNGLPAIKFKINAGVSVQDIHIKNNIISATNDYGCNIYSSAGFYPVSINNNILYNVTPLGFNLNLYNPDDPNSVYNPSAPMFNYQCDPKLDANYVPIWNATTMSHCIDNGTGANDPDGSPADIGAFRAVDHGYWQYRFRSGENERGDTYHWVSYPVVNSLTQGKTVARSFFHELLGTRENASGGVVADVLDEIVWSEGTDTKKIQWTTSGWGIYVDSLNVVSPQGFKIKLLPPDGLNPTTVELHHSGFLTPANTPFMIYGSNSNGGQTYENWVGYFDTESSWPDDAFSSIWDDITMIKAKDWCLYRNPDTGMGGTIGTMLPINCGDMVIVTTRNDHEFQWDTTNPTDPIKKKVPIAFNYVEMADYTPVYLDLSGTDITGLQEIGLKLDGVCKGAVVVTDTLEQICAYLDEGESLNSGLVELEFFYESKSQPQEMRRLAINDKQLSGSFIGGDPAYPVYNIKVSTEEPGSTVIPVLSLEQNYPNPFNPTTTIRYSIDEPGPVSLDIYNIKGQLVKSLYRGTAEVGSHSAIWDGLDKSGNACSSGVYFYRLKTKKSSLTRKMLMLK